MENGKKINVKRYLGVYDPVTGTIHRKNKKRTKEEGKSPEELAFELYDKIDHTPYGDVYVLDQLQRQTGLGMALRESFGDLSTYIIKWAIAIVLAGTDESNVRTLMKKSWLDRYYSNENTPDDQFVFEEIGKDRSGIDSLIGRLLKNEEHVLCWCLNLYGGNSTGQRMERHFAFNYEEDKSNDLLVGVCTNKSGRPLMIRPYPDAFNEMSVIQNVYHDLLSFEKKPLAICTGDKFAYSDIKTMIDSGINFLIPADSNEKIFKKMITEASTIKERYVATFRGIDYLSETREIGLCSTKNSNTNAPRDYKLTVPGDKDHGLDGIFSAHILFSQRLHDEQMRRHESMISTLIDQSKHIHGKQPAITFQRIAGDMMKYFDVRPQKNGIEVEIRNNAETFFRNRAGTSVILASKNMTKEQIIDALFIRTESEGITPQIFGDHNNEFNWVGHNGAAVMGQIAGCLINEMMVRLWRKGGRFGFRECLEDLKEIKVLSYQGVTRISGISDRCREILDELDVALPTGINESVDICDK